MADIFVLQFVLVLFAAILALLAITTRQPGWKKVAALAVFCGLIITGYTFVTDLLGRPKPVHLATIVSTDNPVRVVSSHLVENKAIYLWILSAGKSEPTAYTLPWNLETAKKLRKANRQARARGTGVKMARRKKGGKQAEGEWVFQAAPVERLPPKWQSG